MFLRQLGNAVIDFIPQIVAGNRAKLLSGDLNRKVHGALVADVYYNRVRPVIPGEEVGHGFNRLLRGGKSDAHRPLRFEPAGHRFLKGVKPFKRERKVSAAFVVRYGVDFVDDDGVYAGENAAAFLSRE